MGPNRKYKINLEEYFTFKEVEQLLQTFNEVCLHSCSKNNEIREFKLFKTYYEIKIWKLNFKVYKRLKIKCSNCGKTTYLPQSFGKSIFKNGLQSRLLIKFSNDRVLSSWLLNFLAKFWMLFGTLLVLYLILAGVRFYVEPVQYYDVKEVTFNDLKGNSQLGKIVKIKGRVDYTLAFTKDEVTTTPRGEAVLNSQEVYLPLFSELDPLDYVLIRGGRADINNVQGRIGITNSDILKDQEYEVIGRVENIETLSNSELKKFYVTDLPRSKALNDPKLMINSAEVVSLEQFINRYLNTFIVLFALFCLSLALQVYIDKRISEKRTAITQG